MSIIQKLKTLTVQLFPTGRAFKMPLDGDFQKLRDALAKSEQRFYQDATSLLDSALPDNDNFSANDATAWERRLGLVSNSDVSLEDRKLAIKRKLNHPGGIRARQHYLFLERELRNAGFDVYVHENLSRLSPFTVMGSESGQLGDSQMGDSQMGGINGDLVANKVRRADDQGFDIGTGYSNAFFIGGQAFGDSASVDADRETEFRQLILRVKPQNQIAFLLINYI